MSRMITDLSIKPAKLSRFGWFCCWFLLCCPFVNAAKQPEIAKPEIAKPEIAKLEDALVLRKQGKIQDSIDILEKLKVAAQGNHKESVRVNLELAIGYIKAKQYSEAETAVDTIYALSPQMKDNKKLLKLKQLITRSQQKARKSKHRFNAQISVAKGFDRQSSAFSYLEVSDDGAGDDYQVERKEFGFSKKSHYTSHRFNGEYRFTPGEPFELWQRPIYLVWNNRLNYLQKNSKRGKKVRFGLASFETALYLIQPRGWRFNLRYKTKTHFIQGDKTEFDETTDVNFSVPYDAAKLTLGYSHKSDRYTANVGYLNRLNNTRLKTPYASLSYRFSPDLLATVGTRKRQIDSVNALLEGKVSNYFASAKFDYSDALSFSLSYYHDELIYRIIDLDLGLNSGELKRTLSFAARYDLTDNWQLGLNAIYVDKKQHEDFGQDQLKRFETFVRYRF